MLYFYFLLALTVIFLYNLFIKAYKYGGIMKKLICFDLDGTLTQHRTPLENFNKAVLDKLSKKYKLIMVGAGGCERINKQMNNYPIDIIGNYGMNEAVFVDGALKIVKEEKYEVDKEFFLKQAAYLREKYGYTKYKGDGVQFHNSGMVTFPLLGTDADIEDKVKFDPTREKRRVLYPEILEIFKDFTVFIGGSSSFDFTKKQYNKYDAVMNYAERNGYKKEEILFVGDDFEDCGGDSHIRLGGIDYVFVSNYKKLAEFLKDYL
jgi:HAD superfamily hydrolase (TIGR01484 family)